ncbi:MAG: RIP metalloprotease RseP [Candidatus Dadabacteria bacterium]|nr:MAG: RIP metalloprotease RseP [Candidatus Dadabacteria bacterium]
MTILISVLVLGILIFVHELGHFLLAKANGVGVLEFAIGFGPKIWKKTIGETQYSVGIVPLGGYVRMVGDDPHAVYDHNSGELEEDESLGKEQLELLKDRSRWFLNKGYLAKSSIVLAGPGFNLLFAYIASVVSLIVFGYANPIDQPVIGDVIPGYPAAKAGLKRKDRVVEVNGQPVRSWRELASKIAESNGAELQLKIERLSDPAYGKPEVLSITLHGTTETDELDILDSGKSRKTKKSVKIGIVPDTVRKPVGYGEAVLGAALHVVRTCEITVKGLWAMVKGAISPKNIGGPIFIFQQAGKTAKKGFDYLLDFMIFLSVSLAILNLLPIPILDGGHLMFFTIEVLSRKPLSLKTQAMANQVGMLFLLGLMAFALWNDIDRLLFG